MIDESLKNLIIATPVIAVLLFFLKYFMKGYEKEKEINTQRDKQDSQIIEGLKTHVEESNKKHEESNKKQDETNVKIDHIIRQIEK